MGDQAPDLFLATDHRVAQSFDQCFHDRPVKRAEQADPVADDRGWNRRDWQEEIDRPRRPGKRCNLLRCTLKAMR